MRVQSAEHKDLKELAAQIQDDLNRRNHDIEQSSLLDIDDWVNGQGAPLCNVSVNILRRPSNKSREEGGLLELIEVPYKPPAKIELELSRPCKIAELVKVSPGFLDHRIRWNSCDLQDDVVVDIVLDEDSVDIYIEANPMLMDLQQVEDLTKKWEGAVLSLVEDCGTTTCRQ